MAKEALEKAMKWILGSPENTKSFRNDFDVITKQVPNLDADDLRILRAVHQKGDKAPELQEMHDVAGQEAGGPSHTTRSHGW